MGYIVDIEELHDNQEVIISQLEQWSSAFAGLSEAENTYIINTEAFGGQAARAAKEYVSAVHQTLGGTYCQMFDETRSLLLLYVDGYQAIEDSIIGRISEESLEEQQRLIQREQQTLSEIDGQIKGAIASVAHIVSVINPDAESIIQNYTLMSTFLSELDGNIKAYEESHANDMNRVGELLDGISRVMDIHKGTDVHIAPYSDIQTYEGVQLLTLINKIGEGDPTLISAAERVNSLYDEFCTNRISEERMEKGAKAVVGGSLLVLTGIVTAVFISRTAGAAIIGKGGTIVMGAASYVAVTHGTSNTIEGFQEYRYGKSRDTESVAINYVRDYVYLGNERLYNGVTTVGETVCGAYLTGMYGCMYSQACGIPLWKGELIQGGITLASGEVGTFVSDKVSTMDINPWFKATAGPVAGVAAFGVANAATARYIVPSIKQANVIGNVESNRSITEIAKVDTADITKFSDNNTLSELDARGYNEFVSRSRELYHSEQEMQIAFKQLLDRDFKAFARDLDLSTEPGKAYFWSGDKEYAREIAKSNGGTIMEDTAGGKVVDEWPWLYEKYPSENWGTGNQFDPKPLWEAVSEEYALRARDKVTYVNQEYEGRIWTDVESITLDISIDKGRVTEIDYYNKEYLINKILDEGKKSW